MVLKLDDPPTLCKTDEVGELCLSASFTGSDYWGLVGITNNVFKVPGVAVVVVVVVVGVVVVMVVVEVVLGFVGGWLESENPSKLLHYTLLLKCVIHAYDL